MATKPDVLLTVGTVLDKKSVADLKKGMATTAQGLASAFSGDLSGAISGISEGLVEMRKGGQKLPPTLNAIAGASEFFGTWQGILTKGVAAGLLKVVAGVEEWRRELQELNATISLNQKQTMKLVSGLERAGNLSGLLAKDTRELFKAYTAYDESVARSTTSLHKYEQVQETALKFQQAFGLSVEDTASLLLTLTNSFRLNSGEQRRYLDMLTKITVQTNLSGTETANLVKQNKLLLLGLGKDAPRVTEELAGVSSAYKALGEDATEAINLFKSSRNRFDADANSRIHLIASRAGANADNLRNSFEEQQLALIKVVKLEEKQLGNHLRMEEKATRIAKQYYLQEGYVQSILTQGDQIADQIRENMLNLKDSTTTHKEWLDAMSSFAQIWKNTRKDFEVIGSVIKDTLGPILSTVTSVMDSSPAARRIGMGLATVGGAMVLKKTIGMVGKTLGGAFCGACGPGMTDGLAKGIGKTGLIGELRLKALSGVHGMGAPGEFLTRQASSFPALSKLGTAKGIGGTLAGTGLAVGMAEWGQELQKDGHAVAGGLANIAGGIGGVALAFQTGGPIGGLIAATAYAASNVWEVGKLTVEYFKGRAKLQEAEERLRLVTQTFTDKQNVKLMHLGLEGDSFSEKERFTYQNRRRKLGLALINSGLATEATSTGEIDKIIAELVKTSDGDSKKLIAAIEEQTRILAAGGTPNVSGTD